MEELIFRPDKERLIQAKNKRLNRWKELSKKEYTREQKIERMKLEIEVFKSFEFLRERAMKCQEILVK